MQLIFFPYAGGSGPAYRKLTDHLPRHWTMQTIELPGRGQRIREPLSNSLEEVLDDIGTQISEGPIDLHRPYAFFGHSMGSILAFMTARRQREQKQRLPDVLICSGFRALHMPHARTIRHDLDSQAFRNELREMGGVPSEILENSELMDFFEPIIRADFKICEEFVLEQPDELPVPLHTLFGTEDKLTENEKEEWNRLSSQPVHRHDFQGHHFFIFSNNGVVADRLLSIARKYNNSRFGYLG